MTTLTTIVTVDKAGGYSCNPDSQTVTQVNTELLYVLDSASAAIWAFSGLTTSDSQRQVSSPTVSPDGNSVSAVDLNSIAEVFNVYLLLQHRTTLARHWVDPQVRNDPPVQ